MRPTAREPVPVAAWGSESTYAVGAIVVADGTVSWVPSVDVTRIVFGGQVVAIVGILVFGRIFTHRRRHRR